MSSHARRWMVVFTVLAFSNRAFAQDVSEEDTGKQAAEALKRVTPQKGREHRYLFLVGGIAASIGGGLTYWAQGEARRASSLATADDSRRAYDSARASAASANALFVVAALCVGYGLFLELLPPDAGNAASMRFQF